jgi:hypothetical protein
MSSFTPPTYATALPSSTRARTLPAPRRISELGSCWCPPTRCSPVTGGRDRNTTSPTPCGTTAGGRSRQNRRSSPVTPVRRSSGCPCWYRSIRPTRPWPGSVRLRPTTSRWAGTTGNVANPRAQPRSPRRSGSYCSWTPREAPGSGTFPGPERLLRRELGARVASVLGLNDPAVTVPPPSPDERPHDLHLTDRRARHELGWDPRPVLAGAAEL